jgi:hypothetical protein
MFVVKTFFAPCKLGSRDFEPSWLKTFVLQKVDVFYTMFKKLVENLERKKKFLFPFFKKNH